MTRIAVFLFLVGMLPHRPAFTQMKPGLEDYSLGEDVGACFVAGCKVLTGNITTPVPTNGSPARIHINQVLFGPGPNAGVQEVPYPSESDPSRRAQLSVAWESEASLGRGVTVVLSLADNARVLSGEPVAVVSNGHSAGVIRGLVAGAPGTVRSPEAILDAVSSLRLHPDPALAGFLYQFVSFGKIKYDRDFLASFYPAILDQLLSPVDQDIAGSFLGFVYESAHPATQSAIVNHLVELAVLGDSGLRRAVFHCMSQIAEANPTFVAVLSPESLAITKEQYWALRAR